jgi:hypothetical protein
MGEAVLASELVKVLDSAGEWELGSETVLASESERGKGLMEMLPDDYRRR